MLALNHWDQASDGAWHKDENSGDKPPVSTAVVAAACWPLELRRRFWIGYTTFPWTHWAVCGQYGAAATASFWLLVVGAVFLWGWWIYGIVLAWGAEANFCTHLSPKLILSMRVYILIHVILALLYLLWCFLRLCSRDGSSDDTSPMHLIEDIMDDLTHDHQPHSPVLQHLPVANMVPGRSHSGPTHVTIVGRCRYACLNTRARTCPITDLHMSMHKYTGVCICLHTHKTCAHSVCV